MNRFEKCPKCSAEFGSSTDSCPSCGLVFAKWKPPTPWLGEYEYRMVPIMEGAIAQKETATGNEAAEYLEKAVNEMARQGWEFLRVDEMSFVLSSPALFGTRVESRPVKHHVLTFRKKKNS
jgi:hypothetical protein